jgi:hypothetical protein
MDRGLYARVEEVSEVFPFVSLGMFESAVQDPARYFLPRGQSDDWDGSVPPLAAFVVEYWRDAICRHDRNRWAVFSRVRSMKTREFLAFIDDEDIRHITISVIVAFHVPSPSDRKDSLIDPSHRARIQRVISSMHCPSPDTRRAPREPKSAISPTIERPARNDSKRPARGFDDQVLLIVLFIAGLITFALLSGGPPKDCIYHVC